MSAKQGTRGNDGGRPAVLFSRTSRIKGEKTAARHTCNQIITDSSIKYVEFGAAVIESALSTAKTRSFHAATDTALPESDRARSTHAVYVFSDVSKNKSLIVSGAVYGLMLAVNQVAF